MKARDEKPQRAGTPEHLLRLQPADITFLKAIRLREVREAKTAALLTVTRSTYCANCDRRLPTASRKSPALNGVYCGKLCRAEGYARIDRLKAEAS